MLTLFKLFLCISITLALTDFRQFPFFSESLDSSNSFEMGISRVSESFFFHNDLYLLGSGILFFSKRSIRFLYSPYQKTFSIIAINIQGVEFDKGFVWHLDFTICFHKNKGDFFS